MDLILENIRSFAGRHYAPLAPVTLLVGENSSGKTSFLAACRIAWDAIKDADSVDFNEAPFTLGAYNDIATCSILSGPFERALATRTTTIRPRGPKGTQLGFTIIPEPHANIVPSASFLVGFRVAATTADQRSLARVGDNAIEVTVTFVSRDGQPVMSEWRAEWGQYTLRHHSEQVGESTQELLDITTPNGSFAIDTTKMRWSRSFSSIGQFWHMLRMQFEGTWPADALLFDANERRPPREDLDAIDRLMAAVTQAMRYDRPYASAPVRTRPKRTYDPVAEKPTPEGDHVPMLLNRLSLTKNREPRWTRLIAELNRFGKAAGLFSSLDVKRMGGDEAHFPFQIRIGSGNGADFNLIDVGYGVSQVLPILVDAINNPRRFLLLQQPEVHLHPRAQAELGSFLGLLAVERRDRPIIIETHSDYLVDRLRMDIREKRGLASRDVIILNFEKNQGASSIEPISIDEHGNLIDAPENYRHFFLTEERRLLDG